MFHWEVLFRSDVYCEWYGVCDFVLLSHLSTFRQMLDVPSALIEN